jgi:hypothetical protein
MAINARGAPSDGSASTENDDDHGLQDRAPAGLAALRAGARRLENFLHLPKMTASNVEDLQRPGS